MNRLVAYTLSATMLSGYITPLLIANVEPDRVLQSVQYLQPKLTLDEASAIALALKTISQDGTCSIPWQLMLSIAFNESSLHKKAIGRRKDYGLMQINEKTALRLGLSRDRLLADEEYSLRAACRVLEDNKRRFAETHRYWIGLYRSGTAVWQVRTIANAKAYDRIIRRTAARLGYGLSGTYAQR